jgi:hypothetical protein
MFRTQLVRQIRDLEVPPPSPPPSLPNSCPPAHSFRPKSPTTSRTQTGSPNRGHKPPIHGKRNTGSITTSFPYLYVLRSHGLSRIKKDQLFSGIAKVALYSPRVLKSTSIEAEFLDVIGTKILRASSLIFTVTSIIGLVNSINYIYWIFISGKT